MDQADPSIGASSAPQNDKSINRNLENGKGRGPTEKTNGWKFWKKRRNVLGLLVFFGALISYMLRVNLNIAIVDMAKTENSEFSWDEDLRGVILGSFYYGYLGTQLFGGWLSARIGGKIVFGCGVGAAAVLTLFTAPLTRTSAVLLIVLRILEGLFQGVMFPGLNSIWVKWIPPMERSKFTSLSMAGISAGSVVAMLGGPIAKYFGWPAIFYISGVLGVLWFTLWMYFITDTPENDPRIGQEEKDFINFSINQDNTSESKKTSHPWKAMLTSMAVWAVVIAHFCDAWGGVTMVTQLPSIINDVLKFDIETTGLISALVYTGFSVTAFVSGQFADFLRSNEYLTTTQVRKIFICGGFVTQAVLIIVLEHTQWKLAVVTCLFLYKSIGGLVCSGYEVNYLDIAPRHASVLVGIGNSVGTVAGIVSPSLTGRIVKTKDVSEWRIVLTIIAVIYLLGAVVYGIFGSGKEQRWAVDPEQSQVPARNRNQ